jgi:NADPH:quinone reductase-like Zn-dependent oxidoreductase
VLSLEEVDRPVPAADEVLIRIRATTVNRTDCATREANSGSGIVASLLSRSFFGFRRPRQPILGSEFAGTVEAVGAAVTYFAVGDEVMGDSGLRFGAHAEFIRRPQRSAIVRKPAGVPFEAAAAVCDGGLNAMTSLGRAGIEGGHRLLVYGASGSIGTAAVQLGRCLGARVTGVCGTRNLELVRSLGADEVIDYTRDDFTRNGAKYDVIFDAVGKHSFRRCRGSLAPGGIYIATDGLANALLALITARVGSRKVLFPTPRVTQENLFTISKLLETGKYRAVIDRRYPLGEVVAAARYVNTGHKTGNVVLLVGETPG